jgi:hypothetical protein
MNPSKIADHETSGTEGVDEGEGERDGLVVGDGVFVELNG